MRILFPETYLTDEIRVAIYEALSGSVTAGGQAVGVFEEVPRDQKYPYIKLGPFQMVPVDVTGAQRITGQIDAWSDYDGWAEIEDILRQIVQILSGPLALNNGRVSLKRLVSVDTLEEPSERGEKLYRGIVRPEYRAV